MCYLSIIRDVQKVEMYLLSVCRVMCYALNSVLAPRMAPEQGRESPLTHRIYVLCP